MKKIMDPIGAEQFMPKLTVWNAKIVNSSTISQNTVEQYTVLEAIPLIIVTLKKIMTAATALWLEIIEIQLGKL